jgi:hypothetical protein
MKANLATAKYLAAHPSTRVRQMVQSGSPRSFFYGDPEAVVITPSAAGEEANNQLAPGEAAQTAIVDASPDIDTAAARLIQYDSMSTLEKNAVTVIPALSTFNATVRMNPLLGKLSAQALNFNANKSNNEYPFEGKIVPIPTLEADPSVAELTLYLEGYESAYAVPFFSVTITNSNLNAQNGLPYGIDWMGVDEKGTKIKSSDNITDATAVSQNAPFVFYRTDSTKIVNVICIPFRIVATRTCPFMPVITGTAGTASAKGFTVRVSNLEVGAKVTLTIMGRATYEMKTIGKLFNLPACDLE